MVVIRTGAFGSVHLQVRYTLLRGEERWGGGGWGVAVERNKNKNSVISNKLKVSAPKKGKASTGYLL